ncbi:MAG: hypothetical protein K6E29_04355 [Cyanobacteria bacterium RUI128]|nr:hypothetical protein [Cyanobacteria bacterium RUI128]
MVSKVTSRENAYVQQRFSQLPEAEKGEARVIKRGESLWNIARSELGQNAKKAEVNDYMLLLAKVNGLDSVEKMNSLQANTTIYLPKKSTGVPLPDDSPLIVQPKKESKWLTQYWSINKNDDPNPFLSFTKWLPSAVEPGRTNQGETPKPVTTPTTVVKPKQVTIPTPAVKPKPSAPKPAPQPTKKLNEVEQVFADRVNTVLTDPTIKIQKATLSSYRNDVLYHVMNHHKGRSGYISNDHPVMSFVLRADGHIDNVSFEGENNVNPYGYDYDLKYDGKHPATILQKSYTKINEKKVGAVSVEDVQRLEQKLKSLIK